MKNAKKLLSIILMLCMVFSFAACSNNESGNALDNGKNLEQNNQQASVYPLTIIDDSGREVVIEKAPEKIASGAPSITEVIYSLGKDKQLVGVTDYCNYPEDTKNKQVIGSYSGPNIEKLIELEIDMFISDKIDDDTLKALNDAGITVVISTAKTYNDAFENIKFIGRILDASSKAEEVVSNMKNKEKEILDKIGNESSVTVFYEIWHDPLQCAGPGSFMNDLITLAGGDNIAKDAKSAYAEYSIEKLIEADPQVYLSSDDGCKTVDDIKARTGYEEINAIKNNRVYLLNQDITSRPGPRIVDALELIAKVLYPDAFK